MQFYLLDGAGGFIIVLPILAIVTMLIVSMIEALIMMVGFKLYGRFKKAFGHSLLANLASLAVGIVLVALLENYELGYEHLMSWAILYVVTVIIEGLLLMLINKQASSNRIWMAAIVMNVISYIFMYIIVMGLYN